MLNISSIYAFSRDQDSLHVHLQCGNHSSATAAQISPFKEDILHLEGAGKRFCTYLGR